MDREKKALEAQLPTPEQLEAIRSFDTCLIADAIECFNIRLRNEGFTRPGLNCVTAADAKILGYAATFRVKSSDPPGYWRAVWHSHGLVECNRTAATPENCSF